MWLDSLLHAWKSVAGLNRAERAPGKARARGRARCTPPGRFRPRLEVLEDRAVPSVTLWTGNNSLQDENWSDPGNWSNGVPGPQDTAEFNSASSQTQHAIVDRSFTIQGILRTKDSGAGWIDINAPLILTGSSEWDGGSLIINGPQGGSVTNNGTLTSTNQVGIAGNGTFTNNGTIIRQGTTANLGVGGYNNGVGWTVKLDNTSTGVIDLQSDGGLDAGNGYIANVGIIKKTGGTGTSGFAVSVRNSGTIDAESGTIQFYGPDTSDTSPSFGTVDTNGTFKTATGAVIDLATAGRLAFVENGTFTATGSGTIRLDFGALDTGPAGATFNVAGTVSFLWGGYSVINLAPATTLTFNGPLSVDATNTPALSGGGTFIENGTITETGSGYWKVGPPDNRAGVTTLDIASGSTLDFLSDAGLNGAEITSTDTVLLINAGTIEKTGGSGTSSVAFAKMQDSGTVAVYTGTLQMYATGAKQNNLFTNSGSFAIAAGSVLQINNNYTQTATGSLAPFLAGAGQFGQLQVSGQATLAGALHVNTASNFSATVGQSFPVLTAGSVSGTFTTLSGLSSAKGLILNPVYSSTRVAVVSVAHPDTIGVFDPATATWYLKNSNSPGAPDITPFKYGAPGWIPVMGDWNGDGTTTIGVVDPATMTWYLKNSNSPGAPDIAPFRYGAPGWIPVVGDWQGKGHTGIGVFDPGFAAFYLRESAGPGAPDVAPFAYGGRGWLPVMGDWNGDGTTTVGVVEPTTMTWYLKNSNSPGAPDIAPFRYGAPGWIPVAGDWQGKGHSGIGVFDPGFATFYLRESDSAGAPEVTPFAYGGHGWAPQAGAFMTPPTGGRTTTARTTSFDTSASDLLPADIVLAARRRTDALDVLFANGL